MLRQYIMPKKEMKLISVDSYESGNEGTKAFDGNLSTIWHTNWSGASPTHPHNIQIDFEHSVFADDCIVLNHPNN